MLPFPTPKRASLIFFPSGSPSIFLAALDSSFLSALLYLHSLVIRKYRSRLSSRVCSLLRGPFLSNLHQSQLQCRQFSHPHRACPDHPTLQSYVSNHHWAPPRGCPTGTENSECHINTSSVFPNTLFLLSRFSEGYHVYPVIPGRDLGVILDISIPVIKYLLNIY